jgi:hypothetical protein
MLMNLGGDYISNPRMHANFRQSSLKMGAGSPTAPAGFSLATRLPPG